MTLPIIAIDGPTASGKGTLAKKLASHYQFDHLDTGLLYRAVGQGVLDAGSDLQDEAAALKEAQALAVNLFRLDDPRLRLDSAGSAASQVAAIPAVREALLHLQQDFAANPPGGQGAVLDGRDIGTVICPAARAKLYVIANVEIRARRRWKELQARGSNAMFEAVLKDLEQRDARDSQRTVAPLKPAADAHLLDVSTLDVDQAFAAALAIVRQSLGF
jgi:cytidylate kinase